MASGIGLTHPAAYVVAITPSDTTDFTGGVCRGIYVGVTGNINFVDPTGTANLLYNCQAGSVLPMQCIRINSTNTTASQLKALY